MGRRETGIAVPLAHDDWNQLREALGVVQGLLDDNNADEALALGFAKGASNKLTDELRDPRPLLTIVSDRHVALFRLINSHSASLSAAQRLALVRFHAALSGARARAEIPQASGPSRKELAEARKLAEAAMAELEPRA